MQLGQPNIAGGIPARGRGMQPEPVADPPPEVDVPGGVGWWVGVALQALVPLLGPLLWVRRTYAALRSAARELPNLPAPKLPSLLAGGAFWLAIIGTYLSVVDRFPEHRTWMILAIGLLAVPLLVQCYTVWSHLRNFSGAAGIGAVPSRTSQAALAPLLLLFPPLPVLYGAWVLRTAARGLASGQEQAPRSRENLDLVVAACAMSLLVFGATFGSIMLPERVLALGRDDNGSCLTIHASPAPKSVDEHVRIRNRCADDRTITGWSLRYPDGERFRLGDTVLAPGQDMRVFTGRGYNTERNRHLAYGSMLLKGRIDGVRLVRANGKLHTSSAASQGMLDVVLPGWLQRLLD